MKQCFPVEAHYLLDGHDRRKIERYNKLQQLHLMDPLYLNNQWIMMVDQQN
jgi:hypothetical protein